MEFRRRFPESVIPPPLRPSPAVSTSSCTTEVAKGVHQLAVHRWGLVRDLPAGEFMVSGPFDAGGYSFALRFYPSGATGAGVDHLTLYVELVSPDVEVIVWCTLGFVDAATGHCHRLFTCAGELFSTKRVPSPGGEPMRGVWLEKSTLEAPPSPWVRYVQDDHVVIRSGIIVVGEPRVFETRPLPHIDPSSSICKDVGELLGEEDGGGGDVTFHVGGEEFAAHRAILAARSPVFKAELRGPMAESMSGHVYVRDVQPVVFKAMLEFIYTDQMPELVDAGVEGDDRTEMLYHLLAAANRYGIKRLKRLCESRLCSSLDAQTLGTMCALADNYGCDQLRKACQAFRLRQGSESKLDKDSELKRSV